MVYKLHMDKGEREREAITGVDMNEGYFTLIIAASSYVNPEWEY